MTRMPSIARKPATPPRVALVVALAFAATPAVAAADVQIPLQDVISPQYQSADAIVDEAVSAAAAPAQAVAPEVPAPAPPAVVQTPPPAPRYQADDAPQYQIKEPSSNSDLVSQPEAPAVPASKPATKAPAPAREDPPAPAAEPARPDPPAEPAHDQPPAQLDPNGLDDIAAVIDSAVEFPELPAQTPDAGLPVPVPVPAPATPAPAPTAPAVGNLNLSVRIFSPGDDGPVTQIISAGGGGAEVPSGSAAPTTWIWNWNWDWGGGGACDPGAAAPAPGVAGWNWNWTWTCGADAPLPDAGSLPDMLPPVIAQSLNDIADMPSIESLADIELPIADIELPIAGLPGVQVSPAQADSAADAPESRGGRERPGFPSRLFPHGGLGARVQAPPLVPAAAVLAAPGVRKIAPERQSGRDIKHARGLIPASNGIAGPSLAAASAAGAAGASSGPALLTTLLLALLSFFASALLAGAGLPRLKPRSSRLERPG
jgi:hypothetical protein